MVTLFQLLWPLYATRETQANANQQKQESENTCKNRNKADEWGWKHTRRQKLALKWEHWWIEMNTHKNINKKSGPKREKSLTSFLKPDSLYIDIPIRIIFAAKWCKMLTWHARTQDALPKVSSKKYVTATKLYSMAHSPLLGRWIRWVHEQ